MENQINTNVEATAETAEVVTLTREQKLQAKYEALIKRIAADTEKANEIVAELNSAAALAAVDVDSEVIVKLGRKFKDNDTTRYVNAVVKGVKVEEDGTKLYKVQYGVGFDAEIAVVGAAAISLPAVEAQA
jgi:PHP family Zn ribbon phosphoesterase